MMTDPAPLLIMLIDDEDLDQMIYRRIIKRSGLNAEVIGFTRASDAVDYFRSPDADRVDLIFLDINMPAMNGFEFLEQVEPHLPEGDEIPVIMMLTTSMSPRDRHRAETFRRIKSYLNKPLNQDHLEAAANLLNAA